MMQEHPYFSRAQIFFGKPPVQEEEDEQYLLENPSTFFFGEIDTKSQEKIGLFILFQEQKNEEDVYFA